MSKKFSFFAFFFAWIGGVIFTVLILLPFLGLDPDEYSRVLRPVAEARGVFSINTITTSKVEQLINPCVVDGPLPGECQKYVVNGVVTQPPIKIIIDTTPRDSR